MPLTIHVTQLKQALKQLKRVVPLRASLPILSHIRINPTHGTITGTDLEQTISIKLGTTAQCSDFIIPLTELSDILKNLKTGEVTFDTDTAPNSVLVKFIAGDTPMERRIETPTLDEWPAQDIAEPVLESVQVNASFFEYFRSAAQVASRDGTRAVLQTVCVDAESVAAGNGRIQVAFAHGLNIEKECLIPVTKFLTAKDSFDDSATFTAFGKERPQYCRISTDSISYETKLFDGTYPNYRQVIPGIDPEDRVIRIDAESRSKAVATVGQFHIDDKTNKPVTLITGEFGCHLIGEGNAPELIPVVATVTGPKEPMVATMNRDYLNYMLESGFGEIRMKGSMKPITAVDGKSRLVFMPMRGGRSIEQCLKLIGAEAVTAAPVKEPKQESQEKETAPMPEEKPQHKPTLTVVNTDSSEKQVDPFDELTAFAEELTNKAKEVSNMAKEMPRKVRALKSNLKQKDRAFAQAQQAMEQLRKVSGF